MTIDTFPYDTAHYLDDEEAIAMFAEEAMSETDPGMLESSVRAIIRAYGVRVLAASSGLSRDAIVGALNGSSPEAREKLRYALIATSRPSRHAAE